LLALACDGDGDGGSRDRPLKIVTTVAPITSLVENIGGTKIELEGLVPESVNSHAFEPPSFAFPSLANADLIILNGLGLEERTLELAASNKKDDAVILLLGDSAITPEEYKFSFSFPEAGGKPNPHLWLNPAMALEYAELIREQLVALDPDDQAYYDTNFAELAKRIEHLDQQIRIAVQAVPAENRKLLTYHDSWPYWAERYGVEVIGAVQPSDFSEPSAGEVAGLIEQIREQEIPAIFGSEVFPSDVLETIAAETGAEYVDDLRDDDLPEEPGDPYHSYVGLMVRNMQIMISALGGDATPLDRVLTDLVFSDGPSPAKYRQ
ncbi:MAG: metal ABC transporter substrate-binding protein, partial [Vicinamibacterales bacterium]